MARGGPKGMMQGADARQAATKADEVTTSSGPPPINLGDQAGLKRGLDDCAVAAVLEAGYEEDYFVSNVKIGVGSLTIIIALIAQFYPKKYPDNWLLLLVCLVLYGIGTIALSLFTSLVEDECFLITKPRKAAGGMALRVSSRLPRYSDMYSLVVSSADRHSVLLSSLWRRQPREEEAELNVLTRSMTEFYDETGVLHEDVFKAVVQAFVAQYERRHKKEK